MTDPRFSFELVEKYVRNRTFGVLTTIDRKGRPHSTGILYGVSPPESRFALFILTGNDYVKTKNVQRNPNVSLIITYPHHYLRFVPDNYVMFRGTAELVPFDDEDGTWAFQQKRILRMNEDTDPTEGGGFVFIKITPEPKVFCYGIGFGLMELRKAHTEGSYSVMIPEKRL